MLWLLLFICHRYEEKLLVLPWKDEDCWSSCQIYLQIIRLYFHLPYLNLMKCMILNIFILLIHHFMKQKIRRTDLASSASCCMCRFTSTINKSLCAYHSVSCHLFDLLNCKWIWFSYWIQIKLRLRSISDLEKKVCYELSAMVCSSNEWSRYNVILRHFH